jgi:hypothetical protein
VGQEQAKQEDSGSDCATPGFVNSFTFATALAADVEVCTGKMKRKHAKVKGKRAKVKGKRAKDTIGSNK